MLCIHKGTVGGGMKPAVLAINAMSVVKDERADDGRCGQPLGFHT